MSVFWPTFVGSVWLVIILSESLSTQKMAQFARFSFLETMVKIATMNDENGNKFFSRSNVLLWTPAIAGILIVQVIFGWSEGISGILWNIGPVVTGLSYCLGFLLFGRFLTDRVKWPMQLAILFATAIVLVFLGFVALVSFSSTDPAMEFRYFLPGRTAFWLVIFFSFLLTVLGFIPRMRFGKSGP